MLSYENLCALPSDKVWLRSWGGREHLTSSCDFLDKLTRGDLVLADRGFDISEELAFHETTLAIIILPFIKGSCNYLRGRWKSQEIFPGLEFM